MKTIHYKDGFQKDNGIFIGDTVYMINEPLVFHGVVTDVEGEQYIVRVSDGKTVCKDPKEVSLF